MGTTVVHYKYQKKCYWGIVKGKEILPLGEFYSTSEFLKQRHDLIEKVNDSSPTIPIMNVEVLSPVINPKHVICQGVNYSDHRIEGGYDPQKPSYNMIFSKATSSVTSAYNDIIKPSHVRLLDYEIELGLVIGKDITCPVEVVNTNFTEYVAGIVITNDISARDIQIPEEQWEKGKSFRTFCPVGPYLYLLDKNEVNEIHDLDLKLWVNNELRQSANTKNLLYKPTETLTELSRVMDFHIGDLILTGTPSGVAISPPPALFQKLSALFLSKEKRMELFIKKQQKNPKYLVTRDIITASIKNKSGTIDLGMQENRIV